MQHKHTRTDMHISTHLPEHIHACSSAQVIPPVGKRLACGDVGLGAMAAPEDIAVACIEAMGRRYGAGGRRDDEEAVAVVPAG
jgi:hypothetical protein